jgi:hypothetical protein
MKSEPKLNSVEQQLLSLILPAGLLDYFEIKSVRLNRKSCILEKTDGAKDIFPRYLHENHTEINSLVDLLSQFQICGESNQLHFS